MTKLFPILLIACLMACSKDDKKEDSQTHMNPPEWIHGVWEYDKGQIVLRWIFTENNITYYTNGAGIPAITDYKNTDYKINEIKKTNTEYEFTLTHPSGVTGMGYIFKKIDENTIRDDLRLEYKRK